MLVSLVGERTQSWGEEEWITSSKHFITFDMIIQLHCQSFFT